MAQRILAVDDEPHMLQLLERIIAERTPYEIVTTPNSLEVPRLLEEGSFDLIITDLKMPGLDGLDILRLVRERQRSEEVIIITAFGSLETAIEAMSQGVFDYITKPFRKEQIVFTVERVMRWQAAKRDAARLARIFEREPFEEARRRFEREYLRRLAARCGGDLEEAAQRAGLPRATLEAALEEPDEEDDPTPPAPPRS